MLIEEIIETKWCSKCGRELPLNSFSGKMGVGKGPPSRCRECISLQQREYYASESGQKYFREYYKKNRIRILKQKKEYNSTERGRIVSRRKRLKYEYSMTLERFEQMYADQKGCCAICGEAVTCNKIHTDHDHRTGEIRGLLCRGCNYMLGNAKDSSETLIRAARYLNGLSQQDL